jgi:hypothetical protein
MRIGITGHQRLQSESDWATVKAKIDEILAKAGQPLVGVTSLAIGADQVFADAVLARRGKLEVVIPFYGYELKFDEGPNRQSYRRLIESASAVDVLPARESDEAGYFEAGKRVVDRSDRMIAVWNGLPAAGLGGTADIVRYAEQKYKNIDIIKVT